METGFRGTFVISWAQTEIDGLRNAPRDALVVGAVWAWRDDLICVDGPSDLLRLERPGDAAKLRRGAAKISKKLIGARPNDEDGAPAFDDPSLAADFVLTDGSRSYPVSLVETGYGGKPILVFKDTVPPRARNLWIVQVSAEAVGAPRVPVAAQGVVCFTPGTRIAVPNGVQLVEELRTGDLVATRDNGPQEILWIGQRRMSGARLFAMPALRPIRFNPGALGIDRPDDTLLVSPDHRMLVQTPAVRELFDTPEVLVAARDLVDGRTVTVDRSVREVRYIHLMLENHQVLWANNVASESFHPARANLDLLSDADRSYLDGVTDDILNDPDAYGALARRTLSVGETAILLHEAA